VRQINPYKTRKKGKDLTTYEATEAKLIKCLEIVNNRLKLKINDNYMYQVQGQLNISKKEWCYFVVWTKKGIYGTKKYGSCSL
jgi:hypothetical protein